jgi:hypothetical protein
MKKYYSQLLFVLLGAFLFQLLFLYVFRSHQLEKLAWAGESMTGIVAVTALVGFLYQVKRDSDLAAISLIGFFREKIIPQKNAFDEEVLAVGDSSYKKPQLIKLENFKLWWLRLYHKDVSDEQLDFYIKHPELQNSLLKLFNTLEEFALRVEYMDLVSHPALSSIRSGYILCIEENVGWILSFTTLHPDGYPGIRKLYDAWKEFGERDSEEEQAKKVRERLIEEVKAEKARQEENLVRN